MKLKFTNSSGQTIELYGRPFRLYKIEGLGDVEAINQTQKAPYQDGSTLIDTILNERYPSIELKITAKNENELIDYRRYLSSVFNPKLGEGTFYLETSTDIRILKATSESIPFFPDGAGNRGRTFQKALINLMAPNPYWQDPQEISRALRAYQGKFKFPFKFPIQFGISGDSTILENNGDTDAPVKINIQGPVTNPQIINKTTGQYIRVNRSLSADEVLHIDTSDQNKRVEIYRNGETIEKAIGYLDHYSDFWKLEVGQNEIQYIADAGVADAIVSVAWNNHYVGV